MKFDRIDSQVDTCGRFADINKRYKDVTGFDRSLIIGKHYTFILPKERVFYSAAIRRQFLQG